MDAGAFLLELLPYTFSGFVYDEASRSGRPFCLMLAAVNDGNASGGARCRYQDHRRAKQPLQSPCEL